MGILISVKFYVIREETCHCPWPLQLYRRLLKPRGRAQAGPWRTIANRERDDRAQTATRPGAFKRGAKNAVRLCLHVSPLPMEAARA